MRGNVVVCLAVCVWMTSAAWAQDQPTRAANRQDEEVNIAAPNPAEDGTLRIFRTGDKQEMNRYISEVVELRNTDAIEVLPYVRTAVAQERGFARVMKYLEGDREFIQVVTTEQQMPSVIATIKALDLKGAISHPGEKRVAMRMKYRLASEVASVVARTTLQPEGRAVADDITNTLYLADSFSDVGQHEMIREFYDVPAPQVEFDVQVVEIREGDLGPDKVGVDWDAFKRSYSGQIDGTFNLFEGGKRFGRIDGLLGLDARVLLDFLNFVVQEGHGEIIQRAKVTANNLVPAVINSTQRVPYIDYERAGGPVSVVTEANPRVNGADEDRPGGDDYPLTDPRIVTITPQPHFERADLGEDEEGIAIVVRPVIATELVTAEVSVAVQSVVSYDQLDRPIVATRNLETVVTLEDGKPLRIGALERNIVTEYSRGIAFLKGLQRLPVLNRLLKVDGERGEKSHLFVMLTPHFSNMYKYGAKRLSTSPPEGFEGDLMVLTTPEYAKRVSSQILPPE